MRKCHSLDDEIGRQLEDYSRKCQSITVTISLTNKRTSIELRDEIDRIIKRIRDDKIPLPLCRFWLTHDQLMAAYQNLRRQEPSLSQRSHVELKGHPDQMWMPTLFRGKGVQLICQKGDWHNVDILVDYFTEYERVRCRKDYNKALTADWLDDVILKRAITAAINEVGTSEIIVDQQLLRQGMFLVCRELALFRVTRAKHLTNLILNNQASGKRWLDISAGWGDRLLAACSMEMDYLGFDPNERLRFGHKAMIKMFGTGRQKVVYQPFESDESAELISRDVAARGLFDICLVSPPFYIIERYEGAEQSTANYPEFNNWMVNFLFQSIWVAWTNLKFDDGYLAINIGNIRGCNIVESMLLFILTYCEGSSWEGMITFSGLGTHDVPAIVYVWNKIQKRPRISPPAYDKSLDPVLDRMWRSKINSG